ncbi:MAG TPA: ATP-binding protein [Allosphingosinicella sp.]
MAKINVRARAVDLLGRQQVAGIPTAISELFKNAHDAYAKRVEVDYYRRQGLLILRDDGVGMGRSDFERRWLTIGTESKAEGVGIAPPPVDPDQPLRSIMGEKGIGRLAISLIGTQVLVMTRPKLTRPENTTVAFLNWGIFALPGIDLAEIDIPVIELPRGKLPGASEIAAMVDLVRVNVDRLRGSDEATKERIRADLARFVVDPAALADSIPVGPDLRASHGTQFWIQPTSELLSDDIDGMEQREKATPLEKVLLGFSNTMTPHHEPPPVETRFRDHLGGNLLQERIAEDNFFTPEEFLAADHHVEGAFDERGQFKGTIRIYGKEPVGYQVRWANPQLEDTMCGPFNINFAYVQGTFNESRLPRDDWNAIIAKLNRIGGLYIYRDGIRILPYGDSDYDFLDMENRRTRHAGYYFFSYRRIFGVVEIKRHANKNLVEKAGREGFQENRAYRQFKSILENFFIQTAADFFREEGVQADVYSHEKSRVSREKELLERRRKQITGRREELKRSLTVFFERVNERWFEAEIATAVDTAEQQFNNASAQDLTVGSLTDLMREARKQIQNFARAATITRPRAVGLTRELSRLWSRYQVEKQRLQEDLFNPGLARLEKLTSDAARRLDLPLDVRQMVVEVLEDLGERERRRARSLQSEVHRNLGDLRERALAVARTGLQTVDATIKTTLIDFEHIDQGALSDENLRTTRERFENEILEAAEEQAGLLQKLRDQLKGAATPEALERDEVLEALEGELEERRERDLESLQLAQMGMAIGIVHHEFQAVIRSVRHNVRKLKPWADRNEPLQALYQDIDRSYSHLDSYLSLFAPLNRRLTQTKTVIAGSDIYGYIRELLGDRIRRHGIELDPTAEFLNVEVVEYVSTLYPPFVNLIDNAIFWLNTGDQIVREGHASRSKRIVLDYCGGAFVISDTGPGVLTEDQDAVFEPGFSRKPNGSGLGLYITRSLLEQAGYVMRLDPYERGKGGTFRIYVPSETVATEGDEDEAL